MDSSDRKSEILDSAMKMVCKHGLSSFTTKKVAEYMQISESLIYKYFISKDNLLYCCFEVMHKKIAAHMEQIIHASMTSDISEIDFMKQMWYSYFNLLIGESYRTIFYFMYRDSKYIDTILEHDNEVVSSYFSVFSSIVDIFNSRYQIFSNMDTHFVWTYILDTTGIFARRIISGDLPAGKESTDNIWKLISGGILGLLGTETSPDAANAV